MIYTDSGKELNRIINRIDGEIIVASNSYEVMKIAYTQPRIRQIGFSSLEHPFVRDAIAVAKKLNEVVVNKEELGNRAFLYELPAVLLPTDIPCQVSFHVLHRVFRYGL